MLGSLKTSISTTTSPRQNILSETATHTKHSYITAGEQANDWPFFTSLCGSLTLMSRLCLRPTAHIYSYRSSQAAGVAFGWPKLPTLHGVPHCKHTATMGMKQAMVANRNTQVLITLPPRWVRFTTLMSVWFTWHQSWQYGQDLCTQLLFIFFAYACT